MQAAGSRSPQALTAASSCLGTRGALELCPPHCSHSTHGQVLQNTCRDLFLGTVNSLLCSPNRSAEWLYVTSREGAVNTPLRFEHLNVFPVPINLEGILTGRKVIRWDCSPWWFHFRRSFHFMLEHKQWPVTSVRDIKRNESEKKRESPLFHALYDTNNKSFSQLRTCKGVYQKGCVFKQEFLSLASQEGPWLKQTNNLIFVTLPNIATKLRHLK